MKLGQGLLIELECRRQISNVLDADGIFAAL
jgi:hypothetical protein